MDVDGISVLSGCRDEARRHVLDRQLIAKIEMAMRWSGVGGEEVGVKCGCTQGCCVGARPGVRSWQSMVQAAASTKTNRVGAVAHQW